MFKNHIISLICSLISIIGLSLEQLQKVLKNNKTFIEIRNLDKTTNKSREQYQFSLKLVNPYIILSNIIAFYKYTQKTIILYFPLAPAIGSTTTFSHFSQ